MNLSISLRPIKFKDVFNQPSVIKEMSKRAKENNWPNAMLLRGKTGCGKTTVGQIIAMTINCINLNQDNEPCGECPSCKSIIEERFDRDTIVLDGGSIGQKTDVVEFCNIADISPMYDKKRIMIIEESDQLSTSAKNALHKMLEKPRNHVHFILLSMESDGLPPSIKNRCQTFTFKPFSATEIAFGLKSIMEKTGAWIDPYIPDSFKTEGLFTIAQASLGSFREAIQSYEKCIVGEYYTRKEITDNLNIIDSTSLNELLKYLLDIDTRFFALFNSYDYKEFFRLGYNSVVNALVYSASKYIDPNNEYFQDIVKGISTHPNLSRVLMLFDSITLASPNYLSKQVMLGKFANYFITHNSNRTQSNPEVIKTQDKGALDTIQARLDLEAQVRAVSTKNVEVTELGPSANSKASRTPIVTRL